MNPANGKSRLQWISLGYQQATRSCHPWGRLPFWRHCPQVTWPQLVRLKFRAAPWGFWKHTLQNIRQAIIKPRYILYIFLFFSCSSYNRAPGPQEYTYAAAPSDSSDHQPLIRSSKDSALALRGRPTERTWGRRRPRSSVPRTRSFPPSRGKTGRGECRFQFTFCLAPPPGLSEKRLRVQYVKTGACPSLLLVFLVPGWGFYNVEYSIGWQLFVETNGKDVRLWLF